MSVVCLNTIAIKICSNLPVKKEEFTDVGQLVKKIINCKNIIRIEAIQPLEITHFHSRIDSLYLKSIDAPLSGWRLKHQSQNRFTPLPF